MYYIVYLYNEQTEDNNMPAVEVVLVRANSIATVLQKIEPFYIEHCKRCTIGRLTIGESDVLHISV